MTRRRWIVAGLVAWFALGMASPAAGGIAGTVVIGLLGLRVMAGFYRRLWRWVSQ